MKLVCTCCLFVIAASGRTISADQYRSLADAVSAARNGSIIELPQGYRAVLPSQLRITGTGITLHCADRAAILKDFDGYAVGITGANVVIDGCTFDGQRRTYGGGIITIDGARDVTIRNSTLFNASGIVIGIYNSSKVTVIDNTITGNAGSALFAQDGLDRIEIASNTIDSSSVPQPPGIDTIGVHTYSRAATATNINIHDNKIRHGGNNFAIEIGAFGLGAVPPSGVAITTNMITLAAQSNGGISLSALDHGTVSDNVIDANRNSMFIDAIELVSTSDVSAIRNVVKNAAQYTTYTVAINGGSRNTLIDNHFEGGIYAGTSRGDALHVDDNVIQQNTLSAPPATAFPRGLIWFQANAPNCTISRNRIHNNEFIGNDASIGINFENDCFARGCRVEANDVRANRFRGVKQEINVGEGVANTLTGELQ